MSHNAFLIAISQMACKKKVDVAIEGSTLSIQPLSQKGKWLLSSCVFSAEGDLPPSVQQCVSSASLLKHQYGEASLKYDPELECVFLIQEVEMPLGSYLALKKDGMRGVLLLNCSRNPWR